VRFRFEGRASADDDDGPSMGRRALSDFDWSQSREAGNKSAAWKVDIGLHPRQNLIKTLHDFMRIGTAV
jgi:hypothetical protein